jgi:hypothetical protein
MIKLFDRTTRKMIVPPQDIDLSEVPDNYVIVKPNGQYDIYGKAIYYGDILEEDMQGVFHTDLSMLIVIDDSHPQINFPESHRIIGNIYEGLPKNYRLNYLY